MKAPAFSFYVRDWLCSASVARMTGDQVKAYVYLLCASWLQDDTATLPSDDASLAALARVSPEDWDDMKSAVLPLFKPTGHGRLFNERLYAELVKQDNRRLAAEMREQKRRTKEAQAEHNGSTAKARPKHKRRTALEDETGTENEAAIATTREKKLRGFRSPSPNRDHEPL